MSTKIFILTNFIILAGMVMAEYKTESFTLIATVLLNANGVLSPQLNASSIDIASLTMNPVLSSILPSVSDISSLSKSSLPDINAAEIMLKEPGFTLLAIAFGLMTGGMAML